MYRSKAKLMKQIIDQYGWKVALIIFKTLDPWEVSEHDLELILEKKGDNQK